MQKILIIDFGSQITQLIARRVRELHVYCMIYSYDACENEIRNFAPSGIILSGGPNSIYDANAPQLPTYLLELGVPILGICYGMQALANHFGGRVIQATNREFGLSTLQLVTQSPLFAGINQTDSSNNNIKNTTQEFGWQFTTARNKDEKGKNNEYRTQTEVWMSHGDSVDALPTDFIVIASNEDCPIAAIEHRQKALYGLQFHPEVTHTKNGTQIIANFVYNICHCVPTWTMAAYAKEAVATIKEQVGENKVVLALSGGVDSSVAALLISQAIGNNLTCIFVDNGLLRLNEAQQVMENYAKHFGLNIVQVNAQEEFLSALQNVSDPESKRKIIGKLFIEIFERVAKTIPQVKYLAQGTIYPDVIESAGGDNKAAHSIKSHHNVGGLPKTLNLKLLEPLRMLFKDEVRELGIELGLKHELVYRHPFPGPGLAVRIIGAVNYEHIRLLQLADDIFIKELKNNGYYDKVAQAFAVFLPIKSVGVMGDMRTYEYVIALRAVQSSDFMTANVADLPLSLISQIASKIINQVKGINRVVYDVSTKPPATIEWE